MYLDRKNIYDFIDSKLNLNKIKLAKKMFCVPSHLSPQRPYDPVRLYDAVFKVEVEVDEKDKAKANEKIKEKESDILNSLKYFLRRKGFGESLTDMWEKKYEDFIRELLIRANVSPPPKGKSLNKKKITMIPALQTDPLEQSVTESVSLDNIGSEITPQINDIISKIIEEDKINQSEKQSVHELILPEQPIFSRKTIDLIKSDPSKAYKLLNSVHDDLKRPLTPIKKE